MPLKDFCKREVVCIGPYASALEAAVLMKEKRVGNLVVVEHPYKPQDPIGIVTDRDLTLKILAEKLSPEETKVHEIMCPKPRVALETDGLFEATEKMENSAVRRLPIVDTEGNLKGIISMDDLYEILSDELRNLSRVSARQVSLEGQTCSRSF